VAPDLLVDGWIKLGKGGKLDEYNSKFLSVTGMCLDHEDEDGSALVEDGEMIVDFESLTTKNEEVLLTACFETSNLVFAMKKSYSDSPKISLLPHVFYNVIRFDLRNFVFSISSLHMYCTNKQGCSKLRPLEDLARFPPAIPVIV
jgi:hypothetical protein